MPCNTSVRISDFLSAERFIQDKILSESNCFLVFVSMTYSTLYISKHSKCYKDIYLDKKMHMNACKFKERF